MYGSARLGPCVHVKVSIMRSALLGKTALMSSTLVSGSRIIAGVHGAAFKRDSKGVQKKLRF